MPDYVEKSLREEVIKAKNHHERKFTLLTENFYLMRSALRYFTQKKGSSFNSSKVAENFPLPVPVAGSCLNILEKLGVVEARTKSSSPDLYMPRKVDLDRMCEVGEILRESHEIREFK